MLVQGGRATLTRNSITAPCAVQGAAGSVVVLRLNEVSGDFDCAAGVLDDDGAFGGNGRRLGGGAFGAVGSPLSGGPNRGVVDSQAVSSPARRSLPKGSVSRASAPADAT